MEYKIINNVDNNRFEAKLDSEVIGLIDYELSEGNVLIVPHTEVNTKYEGQGIAGAMTKALLEFASVNSYRVLPICPYTKAYIDRHPEYHQLL